MNMFKIFWIVWIALFIVVEAIAVFNDVRGDTLSEFVWEVIGTNTEHRTLGQWFWRAGVLVLLAWLIPHMMTGWRWFSKKK